MSNEHHVAWSRVNHARIKAQDWFIVAHCSCGWKTESRSKQRVEKSVTDHTGYAAVEAEMPTIMVPVAAASVQRERAPRRVEAALNMKPSQLERANICGKCGEQLRDERGFYGVIFYPDTMLQLPTCIPCKTKYLAGELA